MEGNRSKKIFVTRNIIRDGIDILKKEGFDLIEHPGPFPCPKKDLMEGAQKADYILGSSCVKFEREFFENNQHIKCLATYSVGYEHIDLKAATEFGIPVSNTPEIINDCVSDFVIALLLSTARLIPLGINDVHKDKVPNGESWKYLGYSLTNKVLGIIGFGRIGTAVARKIKGGWNMRVVVCDLLDKTQDCKVIGAEQISLDELLKISDFVSLNVDLNEKSRDMLKYEQFAMMKPNAIFLNTARGQCVDEEGLYKALVEKKLFAAGLDVTRTEPINRDNILLTLDNVFLTPHIASSEHGGRSGMSKVAAQNIIAFCRGEKMPTCVNPDVYNQQNVKKN